MDFSQYRLIYEYYASRARFGYFRKGDVLPSNQKLCAQFRVTRQTVRKAFAELAKDGYISTSPGRKSIIIYDVPDEVIQQSVLEYYRIRKSTMLELNLAMTVMLNPLLEEGCKRMQQKDMDSLYAMVCEAGTELSAISLSCCYAMLDKLGNPLAIDLYNEAVLYYQFPCFQKLLGAESHEFASSRDIVRKITVSCKTLDHGQLLEAFFLLQKHYYQAMREYLHLLPDEAPLSGQIPFCWRVYRDRPQYCYTLVSQLIGKVTEESYKEGDFLPSFGAMSGEYAVSLSTVRRSVDILNALGISQTLNGLGTQIVLSEPDIEKLRRPALQNNIKFLFHSLQMATLTCSYVVPCFLPHLTQEQKIAFLSELLGVRSVGDMFKILFSAILQWLEQYTTASLREIADKVYEFLLWGYPFIRSMEINETAAKAMDLMQQGLNGGDSGLFSQGIKGMLGEIETAVKMRLA